MKTQHSDDDFLNRLYKQTATEKPPEYLDKTILALAKANHPPSRFAKMMNLQRVLSVAAVMVLSVYVFFEVDKEQPIQMEQDMFFPSQNMLRSAPSPSSSSSSRNSSSPTPPYSVQETDSFELNEAAPVMEQLKMKQAKKSSKKESAYFMADEISELAAQEASQDDLAVVTANEMLEEITQLLASGKKAEATELYKRFKKVFPQYPVPQGIVEAIGK